jgi:ABC-type phosphate transport system substrate-binding protein
MELTDVVKPRMPRSRRLSIAAATAAALALALPAAAGAQGAGQYQPSEPPTAGGSDDPAPPSSSGGETFDSDTAAPEATGDSTGTEAVDTGASTGASGTVTESSGTEELPVTGLPAVPLAIAGFVMLVLGALGVRRLAPISALRRDPNDPSGTRRILGR